MKSNNTDEVFRPYIYQIANIITTNVQRLKEGGLIYGYLGVILFIYHYAKYIHNEQYGVIANNLLDFVIDKHMKKMGHRFSDGLYGMGWALKYLSQQGYVSVNEETLSDYDALLREPFSKAEYVYEMQSTVPLFSRALYSYDISNEHVAKETLEILYCLLRSNSTKQYDLCFLNSIAYFLYRCSLSNIHKDITYKIMKELETTVVGCIANKKYTSKDLFLLSCFVKKGIIEVNVPHVDYDILDDIFCNWQTVVYSEVVELGILPSFSLSSYILKMNEDVDVKKLSLCGISSLGINLIKQIKES